MNKVNLIGDGHTIRTLLDFDAKLGEIVTGTIKLRVELLDLKTSLDGTKNPEAAQAIHYRLMRCSISMYQKLVNPLRELGKLETEVIHAMRQELEFKGNGDEYRKMINAAIDRDQDNLKRVYDSMALEYGMIPGNKP